MDIDPEPLPAPSRCPVRSDLPAPLDFTDGRRVADAEAWADRRAEIQRLARHYVYGYAPPAPEIETGTERTPGVLDDRATLTETTIRFPELPADAPAITLALFIPGDTDADGGVPTVLGVNGLGNHAAVDDDAVTIPPAAREHGADRRGVRRDYWCVDRILERGYGFATYHCADLDPDQNDVTDGIHPYYDPPGPPGTEWGTIAAWAWGLSRCVDALSGIDAVDADRIAVTGHSRRGKAALLAGATDERIALVAPHQSGTGGCALSRENGQETVGGITEAFPHWFADTFSAFAGQPERLPIDQHCLIALVAPRPLLDTEGARDYWANPGRALDALEAADPVYDLLGVEGIVGDGVLYGDDEITAETAGRLLQYRRETEHTLDGGYWEAILDFADLHFRE